MNDIQKNLNKAFIIELILISVFGSLIAFTPIKTNALAVFATLIGFSFLNDILILKFLKVTGDM